jgi:hypothetical protein
VPSLAVLSLPVCGSWAEVSGVGRGGATFHWAGSEAQLCSGRASASASGLRRGIQRSAPRPIVGAELPLPNDQPHLRSSTLPSLPFLFDFKHALLAEVDSKCTTLNGPKQVARGNRCVTENIGKV